MAVTMANVREGLAGYKPSKHDVSKWGAVARLPDDIKVLRDRVASTPAYGAGSGKLAVSVGHWQDIEALIGSLMRQNTELMERAIASQPVTEPTERERLSLTLSRCMSLRTMPDAYGR